MTAPGAAPGLARLGRRPARATGGGPGAGGGRGRRRAVLAPVVAGIVILAAWQVAASALAPAYIARPLGILAQIPAVLTDPQFASAAASTLLAVIEGLVIAVAAGTVIGLVMGRMADIDRMLRLYVDSFYAMPLVALVPLLTVWFGYTPLTRLAVIVIEAILPVIFSVAEGARSVPPGYLDVARAYRAPWWRVWTGVVLPACVPYLLAGLDLAVGRALIGAVVTEFIAGLNGLGYYVLFHVRSFAEDQAMVAVGVLAAFALAARGLTALAVRRGQPSYRAA
jgi:ABC-type nitrate/sulfonate/bicarbonate transport system permease component